MTIYEMYDMIPKRSNQLSIKYWDLGRFSCLVGNMTAREISIVAGLIGISQASVI